MNPRLIDTHSHLHFPAYGPDQEAVYARMREAGIWTVCVGTSAKTSEAAILFAEAHDGTFASVGHHPEHLTSDYHDESEGATGEFDIVELERLARSSDKVVGIGETGLDFYRIDAGRDRAHAIAKQEAAFRQHIDLARRLDKPVIIHCREALTRLAEIVREESPKGPIEGVVHCYTGTWEEAQPLLELGLHLSFTGIITFPPKKTEDPERSVHRVIERMPLERLLVETDAPWLTPVPHRGERNEPAYVVEVARKVAELRGLTPDEVAVQTTNSARELFKI